MLTRFRLSSLEGSSSKGSSVKMDAGVSKVSREHQLNSTTKTKRGSGQRVNDLGIFEAVSSRSKLEREYRKYNGLYKGEKYAQTKQCLP